MSSEIAGFALIGFTVSLLNRGLATYQTETCYICIGMVVSCACAGASLAWAFLKCSALFGLVAVAELFAGVLLGLLCAVAVEPETCITAAILWPAWLTIGCSMAFGI